MIIPTRTLQHPDGRVEVVRVLTGPSLSAWSPERALSYEGSLMWLCPLETLDFVRVGTVYTPKRTGRITLAGGLIVVGYANLHSDAPPHPQRKAFQRRVFYWRPEDITRNLNRVPQTAIDPATLLPGHEGAPPEVEKLQAGYPRHLRIDGKHSKNWALDVVNQNRTLAYAESAPSP